MNEFAERFESFTAAVSRAYKSIQRIKSGEAERMGLKSGHVMCLYFLGKYAGGLTAAELCRLCHEDKAAVSRTLVDLSAKGYLAPAPEEAARKYRTKLFLTESGREKNRQINAAAEAAVRKASEGISEADRECFYRVFFTIADRLEAFGRYG